jgi:predicted porin
MKKTLVALAAVSAVSAFAQSTVTLSGFWDAGYKVTNAADNTSDKKEIAGNNIATSRLIFSGAEDLGGGMKAEFKGVGLFSTTSPLSGNGATAAASGAVSAYGFSENNNFFNDELWVGLSGNFGAVKIGAPDLSPHTTNGKIQPFGTAMGGAYAGSGVSRFGATNTGYGIAGYMKASANGRPVRAEKSVRYDTPTYMGFSASYSYAAQNSNQTDATKTSANSNGINDYSLNYTQGPLTLAYAATTIGSGAYVAQGFTSATAALATSALTANSEIKLVMYGGNYAFANGLTVYYGGTTTKSTGLATNLDVASSNFALKYQLTPVMTVMANSVKVDERAASLIGKDQKMLGLGLNYDLSKRTTAYVRYEDYNTDRSSIASGGKGVKTQAFGLMHQF